MKIFLLVNEFEKNIGGFRRIIDELNARFR